MKAELVIGTMESLADREKALILQGFFKTGPGQYGEGDIFLGITVPQSRKVAKEYGDLPFVEIRKLLKSAIHEIRLVALLLLVERFQKGTGVEQEQVYDFYLQNTRFVNNWDLVDLTAPQIVGRFLADRKRSILYQLVRSSVLWERRIAIVATFHFIRQNDFKDTVRISEKLLDDKEDLIHKAVGWMLREVGKRDVNTLESFLREHCADMPRTTLRYAIEKFPEEQRQVWLKA